MSELMSSEFARAAGYIALVAIFIFICFAVYLRVKSSSEREDEIERALADFGNIRITLNEISRKLGEIGDEIKLEKKYSTAQTIVSRLEAIEAAIAKLDKS